MFPADKIPYQWTKPCAFVVNVDGSSQPGSHWVAIFADSDGKGIFFDSYGLPPAVSHHIDRLRRNCNVYEWNIQRMQSIDSDVCGHYCIAFLYYMSTGHSLNDFCTIFSNNTRTNDYLSVSLYKNIIRHRKHCRGSKTVCSSCKQYCKPRKTYM